MKITKAAMKQFMANPQKRGDHGFTLHDPFYELNLTPEGGGPRDKLALDLMVIQAGQSGPKLGLTIFQGLKLIKSVNGPVNFWRAVMDHLNSPEGEKALAFIEAVDAKQKAEA